MNGRVAKKIRKAVYKEEKEEPAHERGYTELMGGTLICTGNRRKYKMAKKIYKEFKTIGETLEIKQ